MLNNLTTIMGKSNFDFMNAVIARHEADFAEHAVCHCEARSNPYDW